MKFIHTMLKRKRRDDDDDGDGEKFSFTSHRMFFSHFAWLIFALTFPLIETVIKSLTNTQSHTHLGKKSIFIK